MISKIEFQATFLNTNLGIKIGLLCGFISVLDTFKKHKFAL